MTAGRPLRMGVIGGGAIGAAHAGAIAAAPDAELVAVVDPDPAARERAAAAWCRPTYASTAAALAGVELDAASVCAPPHRHRDIAEALLGAGVHVLCEKPLAPTASDARAMAEQAREAGRTLVVSSKFRHVDALAGARHRIAGGEIGRPIACEVTFCARVPAANDWKSDPAVSGGGVVMDNGSHAYDVLAVVLGPPVEPVAAAFGPRVVAPEVEDTAEILVEVGAGTLGRIALSWTYFTRDLDYVVVHGTEGSVRVGWTGGGIRRHGAPAWEPFGAPYDKRTAFAGLLAAFLGRVRGGPATDDEDGVGAVTFIERAYALAGVTAR